jgi:peptidoglycan/xylan/chitin deacetylase (PgdA/CDA1 family)
MDLKILQERIMLITWVFVPVILVWFTTGYLVNINRQPQWVTESRESGKDEMQILGAVTEVAPKPDVEAIKAHANGLVTLWFDDAWESQYVFGLSKLDEMEMVGAVAVPTKMINYPDYMSWYQIKMLQNKGWEITSHTRNHSCKPEDMTQQYIEDELKGSLQDLNDRGIRVNNFVTPCGVESDLTLAIAKNYYMSLRTTIDGINPLPVEEPYNLKVQAVVRTTTVDDVQKWLEETKSNRGWLILMFHQIDSIPENNFGVDNLVFNQMINLIKDSAVTVVTPTQALQLVYD